MKKILILSLLVCTLACKTDGSQVAPLPIDPTPTPQSVATFKSTAVFPMGASVDPTLLAKNGIYKETVLREHNSITAENAMKWAGVHASAETEYNFKEADYIADFAKQNNMRLHGHTLIWHSYNPGWLTNFKGDSLAWEKIFKNHITQVAGRYRGKVTSWDVVNEAFTDQGAYRKGSGTDGSIWYDKLGPDYLARAFRYAAEADPDALLFYNEYGQEYSKSKTSAIIDMVADFKKRKIPIHGIGMQLHASIYSDIKGIETAFRDLAATGLKIHISELDVNLSNFKKDANLKFTDALAQQQKTKYKEIVLAYRKIVPLAQQFGITCWNVGDADSWLRYFIQSNEWPLPFDDTYSKKPAYFGIIEGLKE